MKNLFRISILVFFFFSCVSFSAMAQGNRISLDSLKKMISLADTSSEIKSAELIMENYIYTDESNYYLMNTILEIKRDEIFIKEGLRSNSEEELKKRLFTFLSIYNTDFPEDSLASIYILSTLIKDAMFNNYHFSIDAQNIIASFPVLDYLIKISSNKDVRSLFTDLKLALEKSAAIGFNYYSTDEYKKLIETFKLSRDKIEKLKGVKK